MRRARRIGFCLLAGVVAALANASVATAGIGGFGDLSRFTLNRNGDIPVPYAITDGIQLTTHQKSQSTSVFHNTPQNIERFRASFTYEADGWVTSSAGAAFVIQNDTRGASARGGRMGLTGIQNSVAVGFNLSEGGYSTPSGTHVSFHINGSNYPEKEEYYDLTGSELTVELNYDGEILHLKMGNEFRSSGLEMSYQVGIPEIVGGSTAFIGFTGNTSNGNWSTADQRVTNFRFVSVPEPSSFALGLAAAAGFFVVARRARLRLERKVTEFITLGN